MPRNAGSTPARHPWSLRTRTSRVFPVFRTSNRRRTEFEIRMDRWLSVNNDGAPFLPPLVISNPFVDLLAKPLSDRLRNGLSKNHEYDEDGC